MSPYEIFTSDSFLTAAGIALAIIAAILLIWHVVSLARNKNKTDDTS